MIWLLLLTLAGCATVPVKVPVKVEKKCIDGQLYERASHLDYRAVHEFYRDWEGKLTVRLSVSCDDEEES